MYYILRSAFTVYASFGQQRRLTFVIDDNVELFWETFDPSVATLSIITL